MKVLTHFISGESVTDYLQTIPVYNPATGDTIHEVACASLTQIEDTVEAAKRAFSTWSQTPVIKRVQILFKFKSLLADNHDKLTQLITLEHGKTLADASGELARGIEIIDFACGMPELLKGEYTQNVSQKIDSYSMLMPLGVVAGITPFNFPAMVPMWMFPIAIACGNTFILKPSEKTPSAALLIGDLLKEAGLPSGVFNVLNGDKSVVESLLKHNDIQAVSFVGSTPVAEYVYQTASNHGKRVQALGGAKNHLVVMPDANLEQTVNAIMGAAFGSAGERCMAVSVVVAVGDIADDLVNDLTSKVKNISIGNGSTEQVDMGPLSSSAHLNKVLNYVESGLEAGAKLIVDGRVTSQEHQSGYFLGACLFDNVTPEMKIYQEEIFGPVLCVVRAKNYNEAIKLINNHQYGNGGAIFTCDGNIARQFTHDVQVGMVGVNVSIPVPMAFHSFGGWKSSLFGNLGMHGPDGVRFYTKRKTISQQWPNEIKTAADFVFPN